MALLIMALGVMVVGCKKDPDESNNDSDVCRPLSAYSDSISQGRIFEYGSNGKIIRTTFIDGSYNTYTVESGQVVTRYYTSTGQLKPYNDLAIYRLNPQGYIGKIIETWSGDTVTHILTYSPEGYMTKEEIFDSQGNLETTINFTVVDGNIVKYEAIDPSNGVLYNMVFTFLQVENKAELGLGLRSEGDISLYFGKLNRNLMSTKTYSKGGTQSYDYKMDGDFVESVVITETDQTYVKKISYTYGNCKK